jgi:hypothetical protein
VACVTAGCAQILGLDQTTGGGSGSSTVDAPPNTVNLEVTHMDVGASVVTSPEDLTALPVANWLVAGSGNSITRVPGTLVGSDTWEAPIADGTPPVEFTMASDYPDTYRSMLDLGQRNLKFLNAINDHPAAAPQPTPADSLTVTMNLDVPYNGDLLRLYDVGSWAYHDLTAAEVPVLGGAVVGPVGIAYDTTWGSLSGRPLTKITSVDSIVALHYTANQVVGAGEFPAFDEVTGANPITTTMQPLTMAGLSVQVHPATVDQRLTTGPRPAGPGTTLIWYVFAAPGSTIADNIGPQLNAAVIPTTDPGAITATYGNPFASKGWGSLFLWQTYNNRSVTLPGGGAAYAATSGGLQDIALVSDGLDLNTPAPLPINVSINGTQLLTDNMTIPLDLTQTVQLALDQDTSDAATVYQFNVYELRLDAASNTWGAHAIYVAMASNKTITLPNDVFANGKTYMIRAHCIVGGFPGIAEGDLTDRALPYSVGYLDAGIFVVQAQ